MSHLRLTLAIVLAIALPTAAAGAPPQLTSLTATRTDQLIGERVELVAQLSAPADVSCVVTESPAGILNIPNTVEFRNRPSVRFGGPTNNVDPSTLASATPVTVSLACPANQRSTTVTLHPVPKAVGLAPLTLRYGQQVDAVLTVSRATPFAVPFTFHHQSPEASGGPPRPAGLPPGVTVPSGSTVVGFSFQAWNVGDTICAWPSSHPRWAFTTCFDLRFDPVRAAIRDSLAGSGALVGGQQKTLTVELEDPAPTGGVEIDFGTGAGPSASDGGHTARLLTFSPARFVIPAGQTSGATTVTADRRWSGSSRWVGAPAEVRLVGDPNARAFLRETRIEVTGPAFAGSSGGISLVGGGGSSTISPGSSREIRVDLDPRYPAGPDGFELEIGALVPIGVQYTLPGSVTVQPGGTSATFPITVRSATGPQPSLTVRVTLGRPFGYATRDLELEIADGGGLGGKFK